MSKFHVSQVDNDGYPRHGGIVKTIWDAGLIGTLFLFATMALSNQELTSPSSFSENATDIATVVNQTDEFIGKTVTVQANNIQSIGKSAFTIHQKRNLTKKSILVINASGEQVKLPNNGDMNIQVTGKVRKLSIPTIEREFNLNLEDDVYQQFQNQPVIVAKRVAIASQPSQVSQQPENFYGQKVALVGEVENRQTPTVFSLRERVSASQQALPVILTKTPKVAINPGQTVEVIGEVRPFVANQIQNESNVRWDEQTKRKLESAYGNTPVIIAEEFYQ